MDAKAEVHGLSASPLTVTDPRVSFAPFTDSESLAAITVPASEALHYVHLAQAARAGCPIERLGV